MTFVSVIITAHNPGKLLQRSLASVLSQTHSDFECIVIDDASEPPARTLVDTDDARLRVVRLEKNVGVAMARNIAVTHAKGDWVAFLDHDDTWKPEKLALQLAALDQVPEAWFCYTGFDWTFPDGGVQPAPADEVTYEGLLADQMVSMSSLLVRRTAYVQVGGCNPMLVWAQDHDLILKLLRFGPEPAWVSEPVTRYHLHGENRSANYRGSIGFRRAVINMHVMAATALRRAPQVEGAARRGHLRASQLYAAQAFDVARAARRRADYGPMLLELGRSWVASGRATTKAAVLRITPRRLAP